MQQAADTAAAEDATRVAREQAAWAANAQCAPAAALCRFDLPWTAQTHVHWAVHWRAVSLFNKHVCQPDGGSCRPLDISEPINLHGRHWNGQLAARKQAAIVTRQQEAAEAAAITAAAAAAAAAENAEAVQRLARNRRAVAYLDRQVSQKQRRALAAKLQDIEVRLGPMS